MQMYRPMANKIYKNGQFRNELASGGDLLLSQKKTRNTQDPSLTPRPDWQLHRNIKPPLSSHSSWKGGSTGPFREFDERKRPPSPKHLHPNFAYISDNSWTHTFTFLYSRTKRIRRTLRYKQGISWLFKKIIIHTDGCSPNNSLSLGHVKIPKNKISWGAPRKFVKPVSGPKCLLLHQIITPLCHLHCTSAA